MARILHCYSDGPLVFTADTRAAASEKLSTFGDIFAKHPDVFVIRKCFGSTERTVFSNWPFSSFIISAFHHSCFVNLLLSYFVNLLIVKTVYRLDLLLPTRHVVFPMFPLFSLLAEQMLSYWLPLPALLLLGPLAF